MPPRIVQPKYFIDEDLLGLAHIASAIRIDVTYPGDLGRTIKRRERPPCTLVQRGDKDPDWIPRVADQGWLIITRDSQIQAHSSLVTAVRESGARMVALSGEHATVKWDQLRVLLYHWDEIENLKPDGPFIYRASKTTFTEVDLDKLL